MSTNQENPDPMGDDELRLQALFDETAPPPDPTAIQRMARAAAMIPEQKVPWYRRLFAPRPVAIGALAGAAALAALFMFGRPDGTSSDTLVDRSPSATVSAATPAPTDSLDELMAFELSDTDTNGEELAVLDADPIAVWDDGDDLQEDHPMTGLDLLFSDELDDIELLGEAFDDVLTEGG